MFLEENTPADWQSWKPSYARGVDFEDEELTAPELSIALGPYPGFVDELRIDEDGFKSTDPRNIANFKKGTTTLAFRFQGGIIVACDSRASKGSLISTHRVRKIIEINDFLLGTMAGGAADCSYWERHLAKLCRIHELRTGRKVGVNHAAKMLADIFWNYRGRGLSCGTMIAGYDVHKQETGLYWVDDQGEKIQGDMFSVGSGSPFAYGVLDNYYKWDMSVDDAVELGRRAIFQAGHRDGASGGFVRVYHVHEQGWTKVIDGEDIAQLYAETYYPRKKADPESMVEAA